MKWMIASDTHGFSSAVRALFDAFEREQADRLVLLGDLGAYECPESVVRLYRAYRDRILAVRGNCDGASSAQIYGFPMPSYAFFQEEGLVCLATHGHLFDETFLPDGPRPDLLFTGHTHIPRCERVGGILCCNPGSISLPREHSDKGYLLLQGRNLSFRTLNGEERFSLPV